MSAELETLGRIETKVAQLVALTKLAYAEKLQDVKQQMKSDKDYGKILEICEQPVSYNSLVTQVMAATASSERTVQLKVSQLRDKGAILASRQGREVLYVNSGLLD